MQAAQTIGIDLPLKALVWQDASGEAWLSWNDPAWLAARYCLSGIEAVSDKLAALLDDLAKTTTATRAPSLHLAEQIGRTAVVS